MGRPLEPVAEFSFDAIRLRDIAPPPAVCISRSRTALVLRNGARDFHKAEPLTPTSIATYGVDDHHIFPQAYLASRGLSTSVNAAFNRTLIDASTNRRIGARAPSDYLAEID